MKKQTNLQYIRLKQDNSGGMEGVERKREPEGERAQLSKEKD